jgi:hypothetical protein
MRASVNEARKNGRRHHRVGAALVAQAFSLVRLHFADGLNRCRYKGSVGTDRWVGLGVIADSVVNIGRTLEKHSTI